MSSRLLLVAAALAALGTASHAADPQPAPGKVVQVTLYHGQALVTRSIPLEVAKGSHELVAGQLPQNIVEGSVYAEASEGVEVRAVQLRQRAVGKEPREAVQKLDAAIEETGDRIELNKKQQELAAKKLTYLDGLDGFASSSVKTDLAKGALQPEAIEKITLFSFGERQKIVTQQAELLKEERGLARQRQLQQEQRDEIAQGQQDTVNEALLFVEKLNAEPATVRLNYLVSGCDWSPSYTIRASREGKEVELEFNALITQMTGEDWGGVSLALSTASPALSAARPVLTPFHVTLGPLGPANETTEAVPNPAGLYQKVKQRQSEAQQRLQNSATATNSLALNLALNAVANDVQNMELVNTRESLTSGDQETKGAEGYSITYQLESDVSLASRNDQQMVRVLHTKLSSSFYYVAAPILTSFVYREAELKNTSASDLLGGPALVYLDGRFVGHAEMATVGRGQFFMVGLGTEPQLRCARELSDRKEGVQGGNREVEFRYFLAIENYLDEKVPVRLYDRLPHGARDGGVRLTLSDPTSPLSTEEHYVRADRPQGILRWDVEVPPGANLEKALVIQYQFTADYDRNLQLTAAADYSASQRELEEILQKNRLKVKFE